MPSEVLRADKRPQWRVSRGARAMFDLLPRYEDFVKIILPMLLPAMICAMMRATDRLPSQERNGVHQSKIVDMFRVRYAAAGRLNAVSVLRLRHVFRFTMPTMRYRYTLSADASLVIFANERLLSALRQRRGAAQRASRKSVYIRVARRVTCRAARVDELAAC